MDIQSHLNKIFVSAFLLMASAINAQVFDLRELPIGKDVTLIAPATTNIPLAQVVELSPTDLPQALSFKAINMETKEVAFKIFIYYDKTDKKEVKLLPGKTALYPFTKLKPVRLEWEIANDPKMTTSDSYFLQVSSTKPLKIAR